jgi:hypothetical protein
MSFHKLRVEVIGADLDHNGKPDKLKSATRRATESRSVKKTKPPSGERTVVAHNPSFDAF